MSNGTSADPRQQQIDLLKLEYQLAAERYENIYKAIWQHFSYMAALAAGILAFGAKTLPLYLVATIACFPLTFWFLATFIPMDRYGQETRAVLKEIELRLGIAVGKHDLLSHFTRFHDRAGWSCKKPLNWRVRHGVRFFGIVVITAMVVSFVTWLRTSPSTPEDESAPIRVRIFAEGETRIDSVDISAPEEE